MSSNKDKITTDQSPAERERIDKEQEYVKEKGREVAGKVSELKHGEVNVSMPSNEKITAALQHGQESLEKVKASERGQNLGPGGEKVVEDLKRVIADQQTLIQEKNEGDVLQNIVRDFWALLQELKDSEDLKPYFSEWMENLTSVFSSRDLQQFFHHTGDLFTNMRDTDEFLALSSELIDLLKIVLAESTEKVVEGESATKGELKTQREQERQRVSKELRNTLGAIAHNDMWMVLVQKANRKADSLEKTREEAKQHSEAVFYRVRESPNFQRLMDDFQILLQRLVGNQMSVERLFIYSKAAFDDISNDEELTYVVGEMGRILPQLAENPNLINEPIAHRHLEDLAKRADDTMQRLRNDSNVKGAKEEGQKVLEAIKNEPNSIKMLDDMKTLWRDISSGKAGEVIDPDVLKSLRQLIVPLLVEHLNNVPLPSVSDQMSFLGKYNYTIDQMKISLPDLIPENIHLRFEYEMDANPLELEATNQHTYLFVQANSIQLHLHDCHFGYERLTVPKHADSGLFDVDTSGDGLTIKMKLEIKSDATKGQYLDVLDSHVRLGTFKVTFRDSKHNHFYEMVTHMFQRKIKNSVIEMIEEKLKLFGTYFNDQIISIINQAKSQTHTFQKAAKDKTEQVRHGIEHLKVQAKDEIDSTKAKPEVEEAKDEAKTTAKSLLKKASEKAQEQLDEAKQHIDAQRREKELDKAISATPSDYTNAPLINLMDSSPTPTRTPTLEPHASHPPPPVVSPPISDAPIPFNNPSSPSLLSTSNGAHSLSSYGSPQEHHPDSMQFSPAIPTYAPPSEADSWVSAKPQDSEAEKKNDRPAL